MRILRVSGLLVAPVLALARERPGWLTRVPNDSTTHAYFVSQGSEAADLAASREAAFKAVAAQVGAYISNPISSRLLSRRTTREVRISDEIRSSARGRLRGVRVIESYEEEVPSTQPGGRPNFRAALLVEFPLSEVRKERERLDKADKELAGREDGLCLELARDLIQARSVAKVRVGDFREATSQQRRPFSRILENGLRSCLSEKGLSVVTSGGADVVISGEFWRAGEVEVSAKAVDNTGGIVAARAIRISLDAVDPLWMTTDDDEADSFFSAPDASGAPRRARGSISVRSEPRGATIFVDGTPRGTTPVDILGVETGLRTVQFRLANYVPASQEVAVEEDVRAGVRLQLRRQTGALSVRATPEGAVVRLDGVVVGTSNCTIRDIPTGVHSVSLEALDHKPWSQGIEIGYEKTTSLDLALTPMDGALSIVVEPAGARIFVDNFPVGVSVVGQALLISPVAAGPHTVRAEMEGRQTKEWRGVTRPRATDSVTGVLPVVPVAAAVPVREPEFVSPVYYPPARASGRPSEMRYVNVLGAALGGGYHNFRILEVAGYGFSSTLGIGTSIAEITRVGDWRIGRRPNKVPVGAIGAPKPKPAAEVGFNMVSIFPIKLYLTPLAFVHQLGEKDYVANLQLYSSFCFWAIPGIDSLDKNEDSRPLPFGSVMDFGVLLHLGTMVGVRAGMVEARLRKFEFASDTYSGFYNRKFYIAADVSLSAFLPNP